MGSCQQCVGIGGRNVPFCVALAGWSGMEGRPSVFPLTGCSFRLPQGGETRLDRAGGCLGLRKHTDPLSPPFSMAWHPRGARYYDFPLCPSSPQFLPRQASPRRRLRFSCSCESESPSGKRQRQGSGRILTSVTELGLPAGSGLWPPSQLPVACSALGPRLGAW